MNLIVDIGNSRAKVVVMAASRIVREWVVEDVDNQLIDTIFKEYAIGRAIVASTRANEAEVAELIRTKGTETIIFSPATTAIPISNDYHTPETLGADRLAAAVGAWAMYGDNDTMIVDFGTAFQHLIERFKHHIHALLGVFVGASDKRSFQVIPDRVINEFSRCKASSSLPTTIYFISTILRTSTLVLGASSCCLLKYDDTLLFKFFALPT